MLIKKVSTLTGRENTMDLDVTEEQLRAWRAGKLIQDAMPNLSPDQREFLISGSTPEEWAAAFPPDEE